MRGGWGVDALGKFFRRRRRRRRRRRPPGFGKWPLLEFYYGIGASGVRGSIRLVFRLPKVILTFFKFRKKYSNIQKELEKDKKTVKNRHSIKIPY